MLSSIIHFGDITSGVLSNTENQFFDSSDRHQFNSDTNYPELAQTLQFKDSIPQDCFLLQMPITSDFSGIP